MKTTSNVGQPQLIKSGISQQPLIRFYLNFEGTKPKFKIAQNEDDLKISRKEQHLIRYYTN